jgi:hypothetical protein
MRLFFGVSRMVHDIWGIGVERAPKRYHQTLDPPLLIYVVWRIAFAQSAQRIRPYSKATMFQLRKTI